MVSSLGVPSPEAPPPPLPPVRSGRGMPRPDVQFLQCLREGRGASPGRWGTLPLETPRSHCLPRKSPPTPRGQIQGQIRPLRHSPTQLQGTEARLDAQTSEPGTLNPPTSCEVTNRSEVTVPYLRTRQIDELVQLIKIGHSRPHNQGMCSSAAWPPHRSSFSVTTASAWSSVRRAWWGQHSCPHPPSVSPPSLPLGSSLAHFSCHCSWPVSPPLVEACLRGLPTQGLEVQLRVAVATW